MYGSYLFNYENIDKVLDNYENTNFLAIRLEEVDKGKVSAVGYINDNDKYSKIELTHRCPNFVYLWDTIPTLLESPMHKISNDFDMFKFLYGSQYRQLNMKYLKGISYRIIPNTSKREKNNIVQIYADFDNNVSMFIMGCRYKEFKRIIYKTIEKFTSKYDIPLEECFDIKTDISELIDKEKDMNLNLKNN